MLSAIIGPGLALALGMQPLADPYSAADRARELPVSVSRIRAALDRPAPLRLTVPAPKPTYRVEIREHLLYSPNLLGPVEQLWSTTTGPAPSGGLHGYDQGQRLGQFSQPLFSVDLLSIGGAIRNAIASARRSSAEKAAREEVQRALAEFCATHGCTN
jgi:hypothetical protein